MVPFSADAIREVQLLEGINHTNVVKLNEALVSPPDIYMVMPLYQGDLWDLIDEKGPRATVSGFFRILRQVAEGIAACHREHIVHRDIKPENVLHRGDRYVVADLGLACKLEPGQGLLTDLVGTSLYWAPEQHRGDPYGIGVDLWALGLVARYVATGLIPQPDDRYSGAELAGLSSPVRWFIEGLLKTDPILRRPAGQWDWATAGAALSMGVWTGPTLPPPLLPMPPPLIPMPPPLIPMPPPLSPVPPPLMPIPPISESPLSPPNIPAAEGPVPVEPIPLSPSLAARLKEQPDFRKWSASVKKRVAALVHPGEPKHRRTRHRFRFPSGSVRRIWVPPS
ncbi:serine/threonine-protein kinase H1-like [Coccinella septempunctata]|uniref:serine/threonine-protein kinase H1-like n=1 Tax=Coccinella septempunctata TaxID=41139 RepID=UPI001D08E8E8|nr:serine/threonine-protein kinase H1-like [Coccinella septempunctata]